jgi:hypothetical protein
MLHSKKLMLYAPSLLCACDYVAPSYCSLATTHVQHLSTSSELLYDLRFYVLTSPIFMFSCRTGTLSTCLLLGMPSSPSNVVTC